MSRLLLIEPSATLRRVLAKQLDNAGYQVQAVAAAEEGLGALRAPETPIDAVVLGWPAYADTASRELLEQLADGTEHDRALALVAHHTETEALAWARPRANTIALTWDEIGRLPEELARLLTRPRAGSRIVPSPLREPEERIRVLVVDDSETIRYAYRRLLEQNGYLVEAVATVAEAVAAAVRAPYDIAIVDYYLDDSRGDALVRRLREDPRTAGISVAVLTGTYRDQVICDSLAAGAVECMFKNEAEELFLARVAAMSRTVRVTRKIQRERQRLAGILGSVGDGVFGVDRSGRITFVNPAALRLLGMAEDAALQGAPAEQLFGGEDGSSDARFLKAAYADGVALNAVETSFRHRSGSMLPVECTIYPLRIDDCLEGSVIAFRDISDRKLLEEELKWQVNHDSLTKLFNRKYFEEALEHEVRRLKRSHERSAVLVLDLDRFKSVNDAGGAAAGDELLVEVAQRLRSRLRQADVLARIAGDEFGLLLRNVCRDGLEDVAEEFRLLLQRSVFRHQGRSFEVSGSIGVAVIDQETDSAAVALADAAVACYLAKGTGRNQVHIYEHERDAGLAADLQRGWSTRLHQALEHDEFVLQYQPMIPLADVDVERLPGAAGALWTDLLEQGLGSRASFEVLLRLPDSAGQLIMPNAFLPTAERLNLMRAIDRWVVTHALEALAAANCGGEALSFSINLSGQSMNDEHLVGHIASTLQRLAIDPAQVIFEVTETFAIANLEKAHAIMRELREVGCRFALDDFGTGYSSFPHLKHLPVDFIKIDGAFVQGLSTDPMDRAIVTAINDIAHSLGKLTIAESVESAEDVRQLKACGVDYIQGFYLAEPSPAGTAAAGRRPARHAGVH